MLGEPVLQLVFALERVSAGSWSRMLARLRGTHCVEALNVADVLVDKEVHLVRGFGHAADARA
jgi:hypothetical protein